MDLNDTLVVGISATALFDLKEADSVYRQALADQPENAVETYRQYMLERENLPLKDGTGMPLVKALLDLNQYAQNPDNPIVEVVVMSRNSPETGIQVFNNIRSRGLNVTRHAFTGGESVTDYLDAFDVDLFLTTSAEDAQVVIDSKVCAAAMVKEPPSELAEIPEGQVRMAFDGDAVVFDESSEFIFKSQGLESFKEHEDANQDTPMQEGPYATLLRKLARMQERLPFSVEHSPVRIAIVTARNAPAEMRVIKTLRNWGVYVDEVFFLGGLDKSKILKAFKAHIFFDDQDRHLESTSKYVPSGKVPYPSESVMNQLNEEK